MREKNMEVILPQHINIATLFVRFSFAYHDLRYGRRKSTAVFLSMPHSCAVHSHCPIPRYLDGPCAIIHGGTQQLWVPPGDGGKVHLEEMYVGTISFIMSDIDVGGPLSVHLQQEGQRSDGPFTITAVDLP